MKRLILTIFCFLSFPAIVYAATPAVFFSSVTDAPVTGWEGSSTKGAAISIYCNNIGTNRGSSYVTVGGVNLTSDTDYAEWGATTNPTTARGLQRITFFLNSSMTTGGSYPNTTISVTTSEGTSTTIPFHTRALGSNHIYFVGNGGSYANGNTYAPTWVRENLLAGDIAYFRAGTYSAEDDGSATHPWATGGNFSFCYGSPKNFHDGVEGSSISIIGYPGEAVTFEATDSVNKRPMSFIKFIHVHAAYWTFANVEFYSLRGIDVSDNGTEPWDSQMLHMRFVGLDGSTIWQRTDADYAFGDIVDWQSGNNSTDNKFLGCWFHDVNADTRNQTQVPPVGDAGTHRSYAFYFNGYGVSHNFEFAWNEIAYNNNSRGVQIFGHDCSDRIYNFKFHDNYIHHTARQGVIFGGEGCGSDYTFVHGLEFYNNIVTNPAEIHDDTGLHIGGDYVAQFSNTQSPGGKTGYYKIYNNVFDAHLLSDFPTVGIPYAADLVEFNNNIVYGNSGPTWGYIGYGVGWHEADRTNPSEWHGSNNLYYGGDDGDSPGWDTSTLTNNTPLFQTMPPLTMLDYQIQSASPAKNAGTTIATVSTDLLGVPRPQGSAYDIGAYEYIDGSGPTCSDGIQNGDETGIDCGGSCPPCATFISCGTSPMITH